MVYPCKEMELLSSISKGQIGRVKQLVSSGMSVNTVLHSQNRYESATVLGTAAYEGQVAIMQYLIQSKALINFKDPWLCRNALHWACIGGHVEAVKFLVEQKIDINSCDRDNVSPIIFAAMFRRYSIVPVLIEHGADVKRCDRLHASALHYASFHGSSTVATQVIRAGGVANYPAIIGQGTPLANLAYHKDIFNCRLLIEAGYNLNEDLPWILNSTMSTSDINSGYYMCNTLRMYLVQEAMQPKSLKRICRDRIRKKIGGVHLEEKLEKLPLPKIIVIYLQLV